MALNGGDVYWTTANTTYTYAPSVTAGSGAYTVPLAVTSGSSGGGAYPAPAPRPGTALDWLDDETEAVCKLARLAG